MHTLIFIVHLDHKVSFVSYFNRFSPTDILKTANPSVYRFIILHLHLCIWQTLSSKATSLLWKQTFFHRFMHPWESNLDLGVFVCIYFQIKMRAVRTHFGLVILTTQCVIECLCSQYWILLILCTCGLPYVSLCLCSKAQWRHVEGHRASVYHRACHLCVFSLRSTALS